MKISLNHLSENRSLRSVLSIVILTTAISLLLLLTAAFFSFASQNIINNTTDFLSASLKQSNEQLESRFNAIEDASRSILLDQELYALISQGEEANAYHLYLRNNQVKGILNKYFSQNDMIYAYRLITPYYVYGASTIYQPLEGALDSTLYRRAVLAGGRMAYIPTFYYNEMFSQPSEWRFPYPNLFATSKLLNLQYLASDGTGVPRSLPNDVALPVLALYFDEQELLEPYANIIEASKAQIFFFDEGGVFSPSDKEAPSALNAVIGHRDTSVPLAITSGGYLILTHPLHRIGWTAALCIPYNALVSYASPLLFFGLVLLVALIILALFIARRLARSVAAPMEALAEAIDRSGEGQFGVVLKARGVTELQKLTNSYNEMNAHIVELMQENVESRLRERDMQLMAMQMQMEPHFLYNTLNLINWMAINEGSLDISSVSTKLARMLRYTLDHQGELSNFNEDINWTMDYIQLLRIRMGDRVEFIADFDERLGTTQVPILFLQPFIENAVNHGLDQMDAGGRVTVRGKMQDNLLIFTIEDNGRGITEEQIDQIFAKDARRIGIRNVDMRIKLIYGDQYGVTIRPGEKSGTAVTLTFPDTPKERYRQMLNARIG